MLMILNGCIRISAVLISCGRVEAWDHLRQNMLELLPFRNRVVYVLAPAALMIFTRSSLLGQFCHVVTADRNTKAPNAVGKVLIRSVPANAWWCHASSQSSPSNTGVLPTLSRIGSMAEGSSRCGGSIIPSLDRVGKGM
jgi:hypothetical protein